MRRKRFWIPLAVVVLAAAVVGFRAGRDRGKEPEWRTEQVKRGTIRAQISATGNLKAVTTVQVGSQVSGTIAALYADFNDQVKKGQVLAQLDPTFLRAQSAQNRADLERAQVQVRQAKRDSARVFALGAQGLASQSEQDAAQTALDAARASEQSAQAGLDRAQTNLRYATILSPIDGVVISRNVDVGQTVAASLSAPTLFTIANDLTRMQLEAAVDEADIGSIREGQQAAFTVDSYPDLTFSGTVDQVRLQPETIQNVVTYTVVILVENPELKLLPGMTANVTILVNQEEGVLRIPNAALRFRPAGGNPERSTATGTSQPGSRGEPRGIVYRLDSGALRPVRLRTGITDGSFTAAFTDSLREGDLIVTGGDRSVVGADQPGTVNPFAPRFPGMGGGRRR